MIKTFKKVWDFAVGEHGNIVKSIIFTFLNAVAYMLQMGALFFAIRGIVDKTASAGTVWLCLDEFIAALPDGYDTVLGGDVSLSGGEKQRISIARAILKDAPIIILDEATANVDPENEKQLVTAIEELTRNKIILMIAHRLKTVRNADQILVLDGGHIVQRGKHEELISQPGIYANFVQGRSRADSWKLA